jgi:hypothetical protein
MPYVQKTAIPFKATLFETPGLAPLPVFGVGAAQLNRQPVAPLSPFQLRGIGVAPVPAYQLGRPVVPARSPSGMPAPFLMGYGVTDRPGGSGYMGAGELYTDRPWANLAHASISGSAGQALGYYRALGYYQTLTPRVGVVRSGRGLSGYYRVDLARQV